MLVEEKQDKTATTTITPLLQIRIKVQSTSPLLRTLRPAPCTAVFQTCNCVRHFPSSFPVGIIPGRDILFGFSLTSHLARQRSEPANAFNT